MARKKPTVMVKMQCVFCKASADVAPSMVASGSHPMCMFCSGPLATVGAASTLTKSKRASSGGGK